MSTRPPRVVGTTERSAPANRGRLSRRALRDVRRAVTQLQMDCVHAIELNGVKVILRHASGTKAQTPRPTKTHHTAKFETKP